MSSTQASKATGNEAEKDSEVSEQNDSDQTPAPPAVTAKITQPTTSSTRMLDWFPESEEDEDIEQSVLLKPLASGATGKRNGGKPLSFAEQTDPSVPTRSQQQPSKGSFNKGVVKKPLNDASGFTRTGIAYIPPDKYQCRKCLSTDVDRVRKSQSPTPIISRGRIRSPEPPEMFECRQCGNRSLPKRFAVRKSIGGKAPRPLLDIEMSQKTSLCKKRSRKPESDESHSSENSSVVCLKRRCRSPSVEQLPKKVKFDEDKKKEDNIDHFGKYVTSLLRGMSRRRAFRLQKEIISLILEDCMNESRDSD